MSDNIPFPEFPSTRKSLVIPFGFLVFVIVFTSIEYLYGFQTNPVIFFGLLTAFSFFVILSNGVGGDVLLRALGADVNKPWQLTLSISLGFLLGAFVTGLVSPLSIVGIQPLANSVTFINYLSSVTTDLSTKTWANILYFSTVSFGEEIEVLCIMAVFANYLVSYGKLSNSTSIVLAILFARVIWAVEHFIAYTVIGSAGIPSYTVAVMMGMIFSAVTLIYYYKPSNSRFSQEWYFGKPVIVGAIIAHAVFDISIGMKYLNTSITGVTLVLSVVFLIPTIINYLSTSKA